MSIDFECEKLVAENRYLLAECDCLAAKARLMILQWEARKAREARRKRHQEQVARLFMFPIRMVIGLFKMCLFLPFGDEGSKDPLLSKCDQGLR
jgi:hypothetical protein